VGWWLADELLKRFAHANRLLVVYQQVSVTAGEVRGKLCDLIFIDVNRPWL
jgi:hypothetical protein